MQHYRAYPEHKTVKFVGMVHGGNDRELWLVETFIVVIVLIERNFDVSNVNV